MSTLLDHCHLQSRSPWILPSCKLSELPELFPSRVVPLQELHPLPGVLFKLSTAMTAKGVASFKEELCDFHFHHARSAGHIGQNQRQNKRHQCTGFWDGIEERRNRQALVDGGCTHQPAVSTLCRARLGSRRRAFGASRERRD